MTPDDELLEYANELWAAMVDLLDRGLPVSLHEAERERQRVSDWLSSQGVCERPH